MSLPSIKTHEFGLIKDATGNSDCEQANQFLMGDFSLLTRKTYRNGLLVYFKYLQALNKTVEDATSIDIVLYKRWIQEESGYAKQTQFVYFEAVKRFYGFLAVNGFKNHTAGIKGISFEMEIGSEPISMNEFSKMVDTVRDNAKRMQWVQGKRNYALLLVYGMTGMRSMSIAGLKWEDLQRRAVTTESDDDIVEYRDFIRYKKKGKGNKIAYAPVHGRLLKALTDLKDFYLNHYGEVPENWYIFSKVTKRGIPFKVIPDKPLSNDTLRNLIRDIMKEAGCHESYVKSPHSLRHMFATYMLRDTKDKDLVKDLMGHSSTVYTNIYTRMENDAQISTAVNETKVFDRVFK